MVPPPTLSGAEGEGDAAASAGFGCAETGAAGHTETGEGSFFARILFRTSTSILVNVMCVELPFLYSLKAFGIGVKLAL